jgi:hypothetical protein
LFPADIGVAFLKASPRDRQVKARLTESNGSIKVVIVFCDCWDSASFEDEQREELREHAQNRVHILLVFYVCWSS